MTTATRKIPKTPNSVAFATLLLTFLLGAGTLSAEKPQTTTLIGFEQSWKLFDTGQPPPAGWKALDFDDRAWSTSGGMVTNVDDPDAFSRHRISNPGASLTDGGRTAYLRTQFTAPAFAADDSELILDFIAKDGAVFYLNGTEIGRTFTMPKGTVSHETEAVMAPRMRLKTGFYIDPAHLREGTNVIAVSLHGFTDDENPDQRALGLELTLVQGWDRRPLTTEPRHVRVTWLENPQHKATVSWTTDLEGESHKLYIDTQPRRGRLREYARSEKPTRSGPFSLQRADIEWGVRPSHFHHVFLQDLKPDTTYYITAVSDGEASREFHFRTAPDDDRVVKMLFAGDSRIMGNEPYFHQDRRAVNRRMAGLFEVNPEILGLIHGGDYTQVAQWRFLDPWLTDHELTTTQDGRLLPVVPARGNHDRDIGFEETFWWPGQENRYYFLTRLSERIQLITLNTEISLGGHQRRWLAQALERARPESRWLLVQYHRPAWPSVRGFATGANRRQFWVPLFEKHRIDLGLESHDHALKRTVPILNNAKHPEGIVYIGDGGAGVPQRNPDPTRWYLQEPGMAASVHHVHMLEFHEDVLRGAAYSLGGEILDEFERPVREGIAYSGPMKLKETVVAEKP